MKIKIGLVEDNKLLRETLAAFLNRYENLECIISLPNPLLLLAEMRNHKPDVILMDIEMPKINGIEAVKMLKEEFPEVQVLMFTVFEDEEKIFASIQAGASGYLLKRTQPNEIAHAIEDLYAGGAPMTASIARKVLSFFQPKKENKKQDNQYALTDREREVLQGLVEGLGYQNIADKHFISISTVRTHITNIYQKLHVNSKSQAVAKALKEGLHLSIFF